MLKTNMAKPKSRLSSIPTTSGPCDANTQKKPYHAPTTIRAKKDKACNGEEFPLTRNRLGAESLLLLDVHYRRRLRENSKIQA